ncbi:MAG: hypothetical protein MUC44_00215 [Beijerinckiaceae bacterium]|nr:hypothetical protein [Beijerinckiaceae bacterium]
MQFQLCTVPPYEPATGTFHDRAGNRQPQPGSVGPFALGKTFLHAVPFQLGYPRAFIGNTYGQAMIAGGKGDGDHTKPMVQGIAHKVAQGFVKVGRHDMGRDFRLDHNGPAQPVGEGQKFCHDRAAQTGGVDQGDIGQGRAGSIEPGQCQQLADRPLHPVEIGGKAGKVHRAAFSRLVKAQPGSGQRRAQGVGGISGQSALVQIGCCKPVERLICRQHKRLDLLRQPARIKPYIRLIRPNVLQLLNRLRQRAQAPACHQDARPWRDYGKGQQHQQQFGIFDMGGIECVTGFDFLEFDGDKTQRDDSRHQDNGPDRQADTATKRAHDGGAGSTSRQPMPRRFSIR